MQANTYRRSREGAWIEMQQKKTAKAAAFSRSREGAWIEINNKLGKISSGRSRSREGAWIEMLYFGATDTLLSVAPARERGLKSYCSSS